MKLLDHYEENSLWVALENSIPSKTVKLYNPGNQMSFHQPVQELRQALSSSKKFYEQQDELLRTVATEDETKKTL